jgi:hypothetical protein
MTKQSGINKTLSIYVTFARMRFLPAIPLWHLNKVGWKNVEDKFAEKYVKKLEHLQLKN